MHGSHLAAKFPEEHQIPCELRNRKDLKPEHYFTKTEDVDYWHLNQKENEKKRNKDSVPYIPQHLSMRASREHYQFSPNIYNTFNFLQKGNKIFSVLTEFKLDNPTNSKFLNKSFNYKKTDSSFQPHQDSFETIKPRRSSRHKMRKSVASAVFYDDYEAPVRC